MNADTAHVTTCSICSHIPERKEVELLHGTDRLPAEVELLRIIGGNGIYGAEQIRVCPECGTYYRFIHDHDSEAGLGIGYTDERITRINAESAARELERAERDARAALQYWTQPSGAAYGKQATIFAAEAREEIERVSTELAKLRQQLDRGIP